MKLIDADKLHYIKVMILNQTKEEATEKKDVVVFAKEIDKAPAVDAVEVVRCKDCLYAKDYYHDRSIYCCIPDKPMEWHNDDQNWFCADGIRENGKKNE